MWTLINQKKTLCTGAFSSYSTALTWATQRVPALMLEPIELHLTGEEGDALTTSLPPFTLATKASPEGLSIN